ncbi:MAG: ion channel [Arhodomonas sp.]|nr:ion channel [Arhodomonas sp.]
MAELVDVPRHRIVPLVLRRMRPPLLTLISAYAVAILGLVLIPGVGGDGAPVHMSFFHAFYFVTYTASTIGFGEIPHTFTDAQRMWVTGSIYVLVVSLVLRHRYHRGAGARSGIPAGGGVEPLPPQRQPHRRAVRAHLRLWRYRHPARLGGHRGVAARGGDRLG